MLHVFSRMVYKEPKRWIDFLSLALWVYLTSKLTPTQATPFSLIYRAKTMVSIKVMIPSARLALVSN